MLRVSPGQCLLKVDHPPLSSPHPRRHQDNSQDSDHRSHKSLNPKFGYFIMDHLASDYLLLSRGLLPHIELIITSSSDNRDIVPP